MRVLLSALPGPSTYASARASVCRPRPSLCVRQFQSTSPTWKKRRTEAVEEDFDSSLDSEADADALFDVSTSPSTPNVGQRDRPTFRAQTKERILSVARLSGPQQRQAANELQVFNLVQIARFSDSAAELEELKGLMRTWRVLGKRVTPQAAKEIVGRCCNLGRPDLARQLLQDRLQYGMPDVSEQLQTKVKAALAAYTPAAAAAAPEASA